LKRLYLQRNGKEEVKNLQILKANRKKNPGIAMYRAIFTYKGVYHILFDLATINLRMFLEGEEFEDNLRSPSDLKSVYMEAYQLSDALYYLHKELMLDHEKYICCHMDLKPENILVFIKNTKGSKRRFEFKITDLGISRIKPDPHAPGYEMRAANSYQHGTAATTKVTSPKLPGEFYAPEMCENYVGRALDVWALGCILIVLTIRVFEGRQGLKEFDQSKCPSIGGYRYDNFYVKDAGSTSEYDAPFRLKDEVEDWLGKLGAGRQDYTKHLEWLGLKEEQSKGVISQLHDLIRRCLRIKSKDRILSEGIKNALNKIQDIIPRGHVDQLRKLDKSGASDCREGKDPNNLLHLITWQNLTIYDNCYLTCKVKKKVSCQ
jgi:serine/threonine protein kinase